ncbi:MAG: hypothetical protein ACJAZW_000018 [Maritalea sp.]|jgi:hypothetical protein
MNVSLVTSSYGLTQQVNKPAMRPFDVFNSSVLSGPPQAKTPACFLQSLAGVERNYKYFLTVRSNTSTFTSKTMVFYYMVKFYMVIICPPDMSASA